MLAPLPERNTAPSGPILRAAVIFPAPLSDAPWVFELFPVALSRPVSGLLFDYQNILLSWLQGILYMVAQIISHAWHWDHGIQWLSPPMALHGSNLISLLDWLRPPALKLDLPVWSDPLPFICLLVTHLPLLDLIFLDIFVPFSPFPVISSLCFNIFQISFLHFFTLLKFLLSPTSCLNNFTQSQTLIPILCFSWIYSCNNCKI